jgi:hypothetical protein
MRRRWYGLPQINVRVPHDKFHAREDGSIETRRSGQLRGWLHDFRGQEAIMPTFGTSGPLKRNIAVVLAGLTCLTLASSPSPAQHIDYVLGTGGLLTAQQPPPSIYFNNQLSYYSAGGTNSLGPLNVKHGTDIWLDLPTAGWTTPLTVFGANYGMNATLSRKHQRQS